MNKISFLPLGLCALLLAGCDDVTTELKTPVYKSGLPANEIRNSAFEKPFPAQYATFLQNNESKEMTPYKGSIPFRKNDNVNPLPTGYEKAQPYLKNLWLGYPFMYEYNEARGHTYAVEDFLHIDRINRYSADGKGGLPGTCWNCKTPKMWEWVAEYGDAFWSKDVNEFRQQLDPADHTIGCANCHNPETMELRLYSVPLKDWIERTGRKEADISRNEMRSLVCAQCHVEYHFTDPGQGVARKPYFPWDEGFGPEDMFEYYKTHGDGQTPGFEGQFADWIHPVSKTPMIKMQHPEYEAWISGPHGSAGVSCADCHMQYVRNEDSGKISSHWWTSPMKDPRMLACRTCHSDKSPEFLQERVLYTQEKSFNQLLLAQEYSVRAHEAVRLASEYQGYKSANYDDLMVQARTMVRKGQLFWDYISAENSVGFHNPALALDTLAKSMNASQQAINFALQATHFNIGQQLAGNIYEIVPPILEHSRKLQQNASHMKSHTWLTYLPVFPEANQYWDGQAIIE